MGLFDGGLGRALGGVFNGLYPEARLHRRIATNETGGRADLAFTGSPGYPPATRIKAQKTRATRTMREAEGYAEGDCGFIILAHYNGTELPEPLPGDRITQPWPGGTLYSLEAPIELDGAGSNYSARGRPVR